MNKPFAQLPDDEFGQQLRRAVDALPDVPPALHRAALGAFATIAEAAPARSLSADLRGLAQAALTQITALLSFDSWAGPALAAGMRSLRSPTRHLLFSAQGRDIDLRIAPQSPAADAYALAGQILGPDEAGSIELLRDGDAGVAARLTTLDALGEFRIEGLPRGVYRLTLRTATDEVVMPPIDVGGLTGDPAGESAG